MTSTHFLRLPSPAYRAVALGARRVVLLEQALGIVPGDYIVVREWRDGAPGAFTGAWLVRRVTDGLAHDVGLSPTHAAYTLSSAEESEHSLVVLRRKLGFAERQGISPEAFWRDQERREAVRRQVLRQKIERLAELRRAKTSPTRDGQAV